MPNSEVTLDKTVYGCLIKSRHISVGILDRIITDCSSDDVKSVGEIIKSTKNVLRSKRLATGPSRKMSTAY